MSIAAQKGRAPASRREIAADLLLLLDPVDLGDRVADLDDREVTKAWAALLARLVYVRDEERAA